MPGINVRHQAIAQAVVAGKDRLRFRPVRPEFVRVRRACSVQTENRAKSSVLEPANEKLAISRIVRIADDEAANVRGPIRYAGKFEVQAWREFGV